MEFLEHIKEKLVKELEMFARKPEISMKDLELLWKISDTVKNIDKICMLEEADGGGSYASRGQHYVRAHYSRNGGSYDGGGGSYDGGSYDGYGGMSRDDGKKHMTEQLKRMMEQVTSERDREAIRRCMEQLDRS